jgi:broad specificity phosphatase PhoE
MDQFVLLRHAKPLRDPAEPPTRWSLDPDHLEDISPLADALRGLGLVHVLTSVEPKARGTGGCLASLLNIPVDSDARLGEVNRPHLPDSRDFTERVRSYLRGDAVAGWEPQAVVTQRMRDATEDAGGLGFVALVSHGTAISLFLESLGLVNAWTFWTRMSSPDGWLVEAHAIRRVWAGS